jgi:glycyl-tRNA synthetase beta chain
MLDRSSRHDKIARELDAKALRLKSRVSWSIGSESSLLDDVPDLVEYPSVIAGTFASEFTERLPEEVLTATLIHHQHYFPVEGDDGCLRPAFLAVVNTEPDDERAIAQNAERVVTARLRDAMFFWEVDRRTPLEGRIERLRTLQFHHKLGSYQEKTERLERLATWIARHAFGASERTVRLVSTAARLAKGDLTTDMVREFPELQGTMGGLYAREEGLPEEVWKSLYFHYLPVAVEASAKPTASQLGAAADVWAPVTLADRLDTLVGLFVVGERPTGSRDPFGLRRAAHSAVRILTDFVESPASGEATLTQLIDRARSAFPEGVAASGTWDGALTEFLTEREFHFFERRGFRVDEIRAVVPHWWATPGSALRRLVALSRARTSPGFDTLATLFKRVKNITEGFEGTWTPDIRLRLTEPAEVALLGALDVAWPAIRAALTEERFEDAMHGLATLGAPIDRFFVEVLVMADDPLVRQARLSMLAALRTTILDIADIAEITPATES